MVNEQQLVKTRANKYKRAETSSTQAKMGRKGFTKGCKIKSKMSCN